MQGKPFQEQADSATLFEEEEKGDATVSTSVDLKDANITWAWGFPDCSLKIQHRGILPAGNCRRGIFWLRAGCLEENEN